MQKPPHSQFSIVSSGQQQQQCGAGQFPGSNQQTQLQSMSQQSQNMNMYSQQPCSATQQQMYSQQPQMGNSSCFPPTSNPYQQPQPQPQAQQAPGVSALQRLLVPPSQQQTLVPNLNQREAAPGSSSSAGNLLMQPPSNFTPQLQQKPSPVHSSDLLTNGVTTPVLSKQRLEELVREVDPYEQLDDEVKDALLHFADEFIDQLADSACQLAKHRKSSVLQVKDVQLALERNWNMWVPGFGAEEVRPPKKACTTDAHKQRMALIKKTLRKV